MDLTARAGFPLHLDPEDGRLTCPPPARAPRPEPRTLAAMRAVLYDPDASGPDPLYWMYRGAGVPQETERAARLGLRFDLTVLRPGAVGGEPVKTFGHVHPCPPGGRLAYPELYQVVHGRAVILLQQERDGGVELLAVECGPGDAVLIPPGFAHATVNAGEGWLVLANWVFAGFASDYAPVAARRGLAYYRLVGPDRWEPNPRYGHARLRTGAPTPAELLGLAPGEPIYTLGARAPERLGYLRDPDAWGDLWRAVGAHWQTTIPGAGGTGA